MLGYKKHMIPELRKKVLLVVTKSTLGGAQRYVYDLAINLPAEIYDVQVATGGNGPLIEAVRQAGLKVHVLKGLKRDISFLSELRAAGELFSMIRKEKPDILHLNSSKAGALGALIGRLCFVPKIIFTAHGWAFNEDRGEFQRKILKFIHWFTILLSHRTIAVSQGMRKQMNWPFIQKKIRVIPLGRTVEDPKYRDDARGVLEMKVQDTKTRLIDYHGDLWMGTIAELHPIKRINRAIDAVAALTKEFPTLRFIIIHDGQERTRLQQQVRDLGLEEHIFFTGAVEDAARLLSAFDLFVLPSKSEAFGYVLLEAGTAHLPVVATNVGGIPDIIEDGVNGLLVPPDNTPALTSALRRLLLDEDLRFKLGNEHYERSKAFSVERMIEQTTDLYSSSSI